MTKYQARRRGEHRQAREAKRAERRALLQHPIVILTRYARRAAIRQGLTHFSIPTQRYPASVMRKIKKLGLGVTAQAR